MKKQKTINNSTQTHNPSSSSNNPPPPPRQSYKDLGNPYELPYNNFIIQKKDKPAFTFKVADDLDAFIREGGNTATQALLNLPLGIFLDILSRLSIKPLAVCRCVCKTWGSLIHHPHFSKLYHLKAIEKLKHPFPQTSLLFEVGVSLEYKSVNVENLFYSEMFLLENEKDGKFENGVMINPQFIPPTIQPKATDFEFEVIGSCNGLVCLGPRTPDPGDPIYVCNPVIGEYMTLPSCHKDNCRSTDKSIDIISGIGFDEVANEYKVVKTLYDNLDSTCTTRMEVEVYTLGSGRWRNLGKFNKPHIQSSQVFVNGALHWISDYDSASEFIVSFDVGKEEFQVVSPPHHVGSESAGLWELGGNLCLFEHCCHDWCLIWEMKEYGVKDSWAKKYVLSRNIVGLTGVYLKPIKLMENGNFLLLVEGGFLVHYNPRKKRSRTLNLNIPPNFDVMTHVPSLISLKDFIAPTDGSKYSINTGGWYGVMKSITSEDPEFDIRGWKWNEHMKKLWRKNHSALHFYSHAGKKRDGAWPSTITEGIAALNAERSAQFDLAQILTEGYSRI